MEITSIRQLLPHAGEEKYQMLELNRRLESYLGRVKLLEEENQLLRGEIQALRKRGSTKGQKQAQEEALHQARREVQAAWMEKDCVEMEVSNLVEEIEILNAQRQKEKAAQAEAKAKLMESKKKLEDEWRAQIWLREQAAHLQSEVTLQVQVHEEEMESLKATTVLTKSVLNAPQPKQSFSLRELGEDYSQRAAQAWQEAASVYQRQVEQLEESLTQSRVGMSQISQEKKENQLYLQDLAKEMESSKAKRELLEKNMDQLRSRQSQELQKLQAQVEDLEEEKVDLREQIGDLLVDRRNLLQMKICLGLEVATYRALLDSESLRVKSQSPIKTSTQTVSFLEALSKPHRTHSGPQATSVSSHFGSPLTTASKSITPAKAHDLMTPVLSRSSTQSSWETHKRVLATEREERGTRSGETTTFERTSTSAFARSFSVTGSVPSSVPFTTKEALEVSYHPTTDGPGSIPTPSSHVEEDLQEIPIGNQSKAGPDTSGTEEEEALISQLPAGHPSRLSKIPEREVPHDRHAEETRISDEGEDEETEVSTEMARISHAPIFAWEENETAAPVEKDVVSELEFTESRSISVNYAQQPTLADLQQLDENSDNLVSPSFEDTSLQSMDVMNFSEKDDRSDILALVDVPEMESNVSEEELLSREAVIEKALVEKSRMDNGIEDVEDDNCGTKVQEGHYVNTELAEAKNRTNSESEEETWEERKYDKLTEVDEEEKVVEKVIEEDDDVAFLDESGEGLKDSSDPEIEVHQTDELVRETNNQRHILEENRAEEDKFQSDEDEESLNISASWRTDPGDADTLADTRPLIHYKSDDEADANTQASHFGVSEPSDSEDERERHEGGALTWGQTAAKRFDTMEDLSEEPEIITSDDVVVDESAQTLVEEKIEERPNEESVESGDGDDLKNKSEDEDLDVSFNTLKDDALMVMDVAVNDFRIYEEGNEDVRLAVEDKTEEAEINQVQDLLVQKQDLSLESFLSETRDIIEHPSIGEDDTVIAQTLVEEKIDEIPNGKPVEPMDEDDLQSKSDEDLDLKDDTLMDDTVNDFRLSEESNEDVELAMEGKTEEEDQEINPILVQKQDLSLESVLSETRDITEHPSIGEYGAAIAQSVVEENINEIFKEEHVELVDNDDGFQSKSSLQYWSQSFLTETEDIIEQPTRTSQTHWDNFQLVTDSTSLPEEASQEEDLEAEPSNLDECPLETNLTKEKACAKHEEDEQSNLSMLTHADLADNLSLHSGPTNVDHSDLEESISSEDESPNASQCSQRLRHSGISTEELDSSNAANAIGEASKDQDSLSFTGFMEKTIVKSFEENCFADYSIPQVPAEWKNVSQNQEEQEENKEDQLSVENDCSEMDKDANSVPQTQECESSVSDLPDNITGESHDILGTPEDLNGLEKGKASDKLDIFQDNVQNEEPQQPKEKENDPHSFFSSSIKEDIWNMTKFETAATYDSSEPTETERYSPDDTLHPNQSVAFGENWEELGSFTPANGKPVKEISAGQSEEERDEQDVPKAKQPRCNDAKDGVAEEEGVASDDSIEEGDSWSSGEE